MENDCFLGKFNLNSIQYDGIDSSQLNVNETLINKELLLNENIILCSHDEINDNNINSIDLFESLNDEKDKRKSVKTDKETLSNSKKEFYNNFNKLNEDEIKRNLKLKRNRESAKGGRLRKKEYMQNLINENNYLKKQIDFLLNIIHQCPKCNEIVAKKEENNLYIYKSENEILKEQRNIETKKKFIFITAMTILFIINIFNIPFNIMSLYNFNYKNSMEYLRNLSISNDSYAIEEKYSKEQSFLINKLINSNGDSEALFIHFAEFYSLVKKEKVVKQNKFEEQNNKNIQVFHENQINIEQINQANVTKCVKCVIELDRDSVKMGGDEFTFYLADRHLTTFFKNNTEDGNFPIFNFNEKKKISKNFSKIFALKCKILGYSINDLFSEKIENDD